MTEHKCCDEAKWFLEYNKRGNCWNIHKGRTIIWDIKFCPWCGVHLSLIAGDMGEKPKRIMSGEYSRDMWNAINSAETVRDLQDALYFVCCRLQELEGRLTIAAPDHTNE